MLFGGTVWLGAFFLPWLPSCLESRDPTGPQRPGRVPAGGQAQSPSPETEPVTSEQRTGALRLHLAFTSRPDRGRDSASHRRRTPGEARRELRESACAFPAGPAPGRGAGAEAEGLKRELGCLLPGAHAGGDRRLPGAAAAALRSDGARPPLRTALRAGERSGALHTGRRPSRLPLPRPAGVTVDLWGERGPHWALGCSQMSRLRVSPRP